MADETSPRGMRIAGWVLTGLVGAFLAFDVVIKLMNMEIVQDTLRDLGYSPSLAVTIGVTEAICLVLYLFPRTALLGAVLLTAVFGGAIATHLRVGSPLFSHLLFGVYLGLMVWGGLWLRDARLRALFPLR